MASDAFDPDDEEQKGIGGNAGSKGLGGSGVTYQGAGGNSTQGGGNGFVNLSQMLALNRGSGQDSAKALNKSVTDQATEAEDSVRQAENSFKSKVDDNTVRFNPDAQLDVAKASTGAQYKGPTELADTKQAYDKTTAAQARTENLGSFNGVASEAAKAGNLSPRQAAASAFYMGASNPLFGATQQRFKGLGGMLETAKQNASKYANEARLKTEGAGRAYGGLASIRQNELDDVERAKQKAAAQASQNESQQRRDDAIARGSQAVPLDNRSLAASMGMSYDEWVAAGSPQTFDELRRNRGGK